MRFRIQTEIVRMVALGLNGKQAAVPKEAACSMKVVAGGRHYVSLQARAWHWLIALNVARLRQAFTSYSNPKDNADTKPLLRTLKKELV